MIKEKYAIVLSSATQHTEDKMHVGYLKVEKRVKDHQDNVL